MDIFYKVKTIILNCLTFNKTSRPLECFFFKQTYCISKYLCQIQDHMLNFTKMAAMLDDVIIGSSEFDLYILENNVPQ